MIFIVDARYLPVLPDWVSIVVAFVAIGFCVVSAIHIWKGSRNGK